MLNIGYLMLDFGFWILDAPYSISTLISTSNLPTSYFRLRSSVF